MLDTSNNFTLEEINYDDQELQSVDGISQIKYEQNYSFLHDFSFNGDHLELSSIKVQPNKHYEVRFYENKHFQKNLNELFTSEDEFDGPLDKIGTLRHRGDSQIRVKLPLAKSPIFLQLEDKEKKVLRGELTKNIGNSMVPLYDKQGKKKGEFNYQLWKKKNKNAEPEIINNSIINHTLQSEDFLQEIQKMRKQIKANAINDVNLDADQFQPKHYRKIRKNSSSISSNSEKSQINYLGYEGQRNQRNNYRLPMQKEEMNESKLIDYQVIKKNLQQLKTSRKKQQQPQIRPSTKDKKENDIPKTVKFSPKQEEATLYEENPEPVIPSYLDRSSQIDFPSNSVQQRGVGTYSVIPSRLSNERYTISRNSGQKIQSKITANEKSHKLPQPIKQKINRYDTSSQLESSISQPKILKNLSSRIRHHPHLSVRNNVVDIQLGSRRALSRVMKSDNNQSSQKQWQSCHENSSLANQHLSDVSESNSQLYPQFDICINNLSVNFHKKTFGSKFVQLSISPTSYKTQQLNGNNLIWIGKSYLFKNLTGNDELTLFVKKNLQNDIEEVIGRVQIKISDLLLNKKKNYFQTFLLTKKDVLAIVILGFEITKKNYIVSRQVYPLKLARKSQAYTEFTKSKTTKVKRGSRSRKKLSPNLQKNNNLPQPRANPIRLKKYLGGKNIKIGRASRFLNDSNYIPGPGDYEIESSFNRHAFRDD